MSMIIVLLATVLSGCVGLDPKNEGFAENAAEVGQRTLVGVMTLGISEGVLASERKQQRLRAVREAQYRQWYDGLSDTEKNIEDMKEAHRFQLMGTIMHGRPAPNYQLPPSQPYTMPSYSNNDGMVPTRQSRSCTNTVSGNQIFTNCY